MIWTYLYNSNIISPLTPNPLTFECVELDIADNELLKKLTDGYVELMNEGFFEGFSNDYNILFVSSYGPNESPNKREKLFSLGK